MIENFKIEKPRIFPNTIISGVSKKNVSSAFPDGISFHTAIDENKNEYVANKEFLASFLKTQPEQLIFQNQIHSDIVRIVNSDSKVETSDALITSDKNLFLCIKIADCCGILLYDRENEVIAAIHSGWKGTMQNITQKTISKMAYEYNSKAENMLAYLAPCGSACCYEVKYDVAKYFPNSVKQISESQYLLDLKNEIKYQLSASGVLLENIEISKDCTICNTEYHSYRRDKENAGRAVAFISISDAHIKRY
ncbi:MAG TPA: peptidoglycan editing factor PgeF [Candidatus Kapabacteria bacterium]|nr:peptidoglycan editing factor PgeF [Candidatus Kapabacteria bacterium]HPO63609.1 peptidoglycan editing factor PgeF [Candidatus Kapabacteria bacterium]